MINKWKMNEELFGRKDAELKLGNMARRLLKRRLKRQRVYNMTIAEKLARLVLRLDKIGTLIAREQEVVRLAEIEAQSDARYREIQRILAEDTVRWFVVKKPSKTVPFGPDLERELAERFEWLKQVAKARRDLK